MLILLALFFAHRDFSRFLEVFGKHYALQMQCFILKNIILKQYVGIFFFQFGKLLPVLTSEKHVDVQTLLVDPPPV